MDLHTVLSIHYSAHWLVCFCMENKWQASRRLHTMYSKTRVDFSNERQSIFYCKGKQEHFICSSIFPVQISSFKMVHPLHSILNCHPFLNSAHSFTVARTQGHHLDNRPAQPVIHLSNHLSDIIPKTPHNKLMDRNQILCSIEDKTVIDISSTWLPFCWYEPQLPMINRLLHNKRFVLYFNNLEKWPVWIRSRTGDKEFLAGEGRGWQRAPCLSAISITKQSERRWEGGGCRRQAAATH